MQGDDNAVTAAEVYRHLQRIGSQLDRIEHQMVPRSEFEAHKDEMLRRWEENKQERESDHAVLNSRIDGVQHKQDEREQERSRQARELNMKIWLAVLAAGLSIMGSLLFGVTS